MMKLIARGSKDAKVGMSEFERTQEAFHANRERLEAERLAREAEAARRPKTCSVASPGPWTRTSAPMMRPPQMTLFLVLMPAITVSVPANATPPGLGDRVPA
jgi:hypothetical protein